MTIGGIAFVLGVLVLAVLFVAGYNKLVGLRQRSEESCSDIDVQLAVRGLARVARSRDLARRAPMDGWWNEIDHEIRQCLTQNGAMTPSQIARYLRMPEGAVASLLSLLVREGKLRIARVELPAGDDGRQLSLPDSVLTRRAAA